MRIHIDGYLQQIFCFSGQIEGHIGDQAVLQIWTLGQADRVRRLLLIGVPLEGRSRFIFPSFDLNRNDLRTILQDKVYLAAAVRIISGFYLKLPTELLQDVIFSERPFELIITL